MGGDSIIEYMNSFVFRFEESERGNKYISMESRSSSSMDFVLSLVEVDFSCLMFFLIASIYAFLSTGRFLLIDDIV